MNSSQTAQINCASSVILSAATIQNLLGISRSTFYRLKQTPDFPKAIQLSERRIGIPKQDFDAWLESRKRT